MKLPAVRICRGTWDRIRAELDRVAPAEGLAVPLVALRPRDPDHHPCSPLRLDQLEGLLIAKSVLVPSRLQDNQPARVSARLMANQVVNARVLALCRRHPRLRACAHLHSHPFARGSTWPSGGPTGDVQGHLWPQLRVNRAAGLEASFSFIACRGPEREGWRLQCFGLAPTGRVVDLGFAAPVSDHSPAVSWAMRGPLFRRPAFVRLHRRFRRAAERRGLLIRCDELFDGWHRTLLDLPGGDRVAVLMGLGAPQQIQFWSANPAGPARRLQPPWPGLAPPEAWIEWLCWEAGGRYGVA